MLYPRDPSLDPQLVWKGKDEQDANRSKSIVPIYVQEVLSPKLSSKSCSRGEDPARTPALRRPLRRLRRLEFTASWSFTSTISTGRTA